MPNKPPRRTSPSRTKNTTRVLKRRAKKKAKRRAVYEAASGSSWTNTPKGRKGKSRTDATPPPAGARKSLGPAVLDLYHKGKTVSEISAALSTSPNRVYIHLKRASLPSPTKRTSKVGTKFATPAV